MSRSSLKHYPESSYTEWIKHLKSIKLITAKQFYHNVMDRGKRYAILIEIRRKGMWERFHEPVVLELSSQFKKPCKGNHNKEYSNKQCM